MNFKLIGLLLVMFFSIQLTAQDSTQWLRPAHKKNIFTLGLYKQPGLDSMVDFVDGIYRVFKVNKTRAVGEKSNKALITFIPGIEYSLATKFATSISASVILPQKNMHENESSVFSEIKYTQNKQIIFQFTTNLWFNNNDINFNCVIHW